MIMYNGVKSKLICGNLIIIYNWFEAISKGALLMRKMEVLIHPIRMKIALALMDKKDEGMTTLEIAKKLKDVSQATLYRHIQHMQDSNVIFVIRQEKVRSVMENYYALNENAIKIEEEDWDNAKDEDKIDFISYYQLFILQQYQSYLDFLKSENINKDLSTFSIMELNLTDEEFISFQDDLSKLLYTYHQKEKNKDSIARTVALTIIPYNY